MANRHVCDHSDHSNCSVTPTNSSVCQTLSEMDWERGIWNAALSGDTDRVECIIRKSQSPEKAVNEPDNSGYTALHYAARSGQVAICELLLRYGANINAVTRSGKATPLQKAAVGGKLAVVRLLIKHGACLQTQDDDGETALHKALHNNHTDVAQALIAVCPDLLNVVDNKGNTAAMKR